MDEEVSHAYCRNCDEIEPARFEALVRPSADLEFLGGNIVCERCDMVIASLYKERG